MDYINSEQLEQRHLQGLHRNNIPEHLIFKVCPRNPRDAATEWLTDTSPVKTDQPKHTIKMMSVANPLPPKGAGRKRPDSSASNTSFSYTTGQPAPSGKSATPRTRPDIQALMAGMDNKLAAGKAATERADNMKATTDRADKATAERADREEASKLKDEASRVKERLERDVKQEKTKVERLERLERGSRPALDAGAPTTTNGRDIHKLATSLSAKIEGAMGSAKMTRQQLLEELEATKVQAKVDAEARDKLKSELDAARVQAKAIAEAKEKLGRELEAAKLQGKEISQAKDVLGKELEGVKKEKDGLLQRKTVLETENATLGAGKRALEEEKGRLESTKRGLETEKERLKTEKAALEKDLTNAKANASAALSEAKALKEAKDKLTLDLQTAQKKTKEQSEEIETLEAEKADLQDALEESQQTLDVVYDLLERSNAYLDKMNG